MPVKSVCSLKNLNSFFCALVTSFVLLPAFGQTTSSAWDWFEALKVELRAESRMENVPDAWNYIHSGENMIDHAQAKLSEFVKARPHVSPELQDRIFHKARTAEKTILYYFIAEAIDQAEVLSKQGKSVRTESVLGIVSFLESRPTELPEPVRRWSLGDLYDVGFQINGDVPEVLPPLFRYLLAEGVFESSEFLGRSIYLAMRAKTKDRFVFYVEKDLAQEPAENRNHRYHSTDNPVHPKTALELALFARDWLQVDHLDFTKSIISALRANRFANPEVAVDLIIENLTRKDSKNGRDAYFERKLELSPKDLIALLKITGDSEALRRTQYKSIALATDLIRFVKFESPEHKKAFGQHFAEIAEKHEKEQVRDFCKLAQTYLSNGNGHNRIDFDLVKAGARKDEIHRQTEGLENEAKQPTLFPEESEKPNGPGEKCLPAMLHLIRNI